MLCLVQWIGFGSVISDFSPVFGMELIATDTNEFIVATIQRTNSVISSICGLSIHGFILCRILKKNSSLSQYQDLIVFQSTIATISILFRFLANQVCAVITSIFDILSFFGFCSIIWPVIRSSKAKKTRFRPSLWQAKLKDSSISCLFLHWCKTLYYFLFQSAAPLKSSSLLSSKSIEFLYFLGQLALKCFIRGEVNVLIESLTH